MFLSIYVIINKISMHAVTNVTVLVYDGYVWLINATLWRNRKTQSDEAVNNYI